MDDILILDTPLSLGQRVRIMRVIRLLTQTEVAEIAGVTQTEVSALERNQPVRRNARSSILKVLGLESEVTDAH